MSDQLRESIAKRGQAKGSITRLIKFADAITEKTSAIELTTRLELLEKVFLEFVTHDAKIIEHEGDSELPEYEMKYLLLKEKFTERVCIPKQKAEMGNIEKLMTNIIQENKEFLTTLSANFTSSLNQSISQSSDEPQVFARLPKLNVPCFSGDYKEFPSFRDLYVASVHSKFRLNDVEKFQYLKGYLRGEAADIIRHITVSETNYQSAWDKICNRYDKPRYVLNDFIKSFVNQPSVNTGSATTLRKLHNTSDEIMRGIAALGKDAEGKDPWLIYMLLQKIDDETKQAWALHTVRTEFPTFQELLTFISERCDALETCEPKKTTIARSIPVKAHQVKIESTQSESSCNYCKGLHQTYMCDLFKALPIEERRIKASELKICFNCLASHHLSKQCYSKRRCFKCKAKHHTLLHIDVQSNPATIHDSDHSPSASNESEALSSSESPGIITANICGISTALLPTAVVDAKTMNGQKRVCNVLLDSGSQLSFISERCLQRLGLSRTHGRLKIEGLATSNVVTNGKTCVTIVSRIDQSKSLTVKAYILPRVTSLSSSETVVDQLNHLNLPLADPTFNKRKEIDLLLGADYFFQVLGPHQHIFENIIAQETWFGYVISGKPQVSNFEQDSVQPYNNLNLNLSEIDDLDKLLAKFWEQEEVVQTRTLSDEDQYCENHFVSTHKIINGRFIVQLPIKPDKQLLGDSYHTALQRLKAMERKRMRNSTFSQLYIDFMREYQELGHMRKLSNANLNSKTSDVFYLPHHGVERTDSATTKLRVVFDGSASSSSGVSLNDNLLVGPSLQDTLWAIILRFRAFKVAICGDIEKMYRQVMVDPIHTSLQRILWRESPNDAINHYELTTVTYGTACAPFLAVRALLQIANNCENQYPNVAMVIRQNFYVDDVLTGADNEETAITLKKQLSTVLANNGFVLRKWRSNSSHISDGEHEAHISDETYQSRLLGLYWNTTLDNFSFKVAELTKLASTKRMVLSIASQIFDPMGWLSPFTINSKVFLQSLWLLKISWDEPLPQLQQELWQTIQRQFKELIQVSIPRYIGNMTNDIQIHGFSDSSEVAYSAAVYVRTLTDNKVTVSLLTAKCKVAPIKQVSLPRLELCGAHLLSKLVKKIIDTYNLNGVSTWLWTDSTIVVAWLSSHPRNWKTYVANRVSTIHQLVPEARWHHIRGTDNPADLATRGISVNKLIGSTLWWNGPNWLRNDEQQWPVEPNVIKTSHEKRKTEIHSLHATVTQYNRHPVVELWDRTSSWTKLVRIMAYIQRFAQNITSQIRAKGHLSLAELNRAESTIIKTLQGIELNSDISALRKHSKVSSNSKLISLAPFIDQNGILRVGGRLQNAQCTYEMKHPIILPRGHTVTKLILRYMHVKFMHPGPSLLLALSRHQYWILGGRELCRMICHKCITCFKQSSLKSSQQMGSLPESRITPSRPFAIVGVDYAGPIVLASKKGRGAKLNKGFLVIFVCFATKALHLEVSSDLTTDAFLAALYRFVARRGAPSIIHSDNGTNFVGAKRKLYEHYQMLSSDDSQSKVSMFATTNQIQWKFIPPLSPHFGGIWERAVRSVKGHLIKFTGNAHLTFEEMITVMAQIEGILNSRPLCVIRNEDVCQINTLTPSHFLTLAPITSVPHADYSDVNISRLDRWERVQKIVQQFWKEYSRTYLTNLQQRYKWKQPQLNLQINDVVLMYDNKSSPCAWPLGRIVELHPGKDNISRVATVACRSSTFKRPICKLFKLPIDD